MSDYGRLPVPRLTPDLLGLVKTGQVFSLGVDFSEGMLTPGPVMKSYSIAPHLRHGDPSTINPASAAAEVIRMSTHVGTHIDALCHIAERRDAAGNPDENGEPFLYSPTGEPIRARDCVSSARQLHYSIETMPPIVARAVLLDVAGYKGVDILPPAYPVGAEDLRGTMESQGTEIRENTAVLVRHRILSISARWQSALPRSANRYKSGSGAIPGGARDAPGWRGQYGGGGPASLQSFGSSFSCSCTAASPISRISISTSWPRPNATNSC